MDYKFKDIEREWQADWAAKKLYKADNQSDKPKCYVLDMFPYPSGAGLHVGHPLGYIASDIYARFKRLKGFNVLHPMGYDSFGLPAEQYAIQTGQHPAITTAANVARYREQLDRIGFSFDWDREVRTSEPEYYRWTQWIFAQLFNSWYNTEIQKAEDISTLRARFATEGNLLVQATNDCEQQFDAAAWKSYSEQEQEKILLHYRLAYLADSWVNWCPALGTVLANDEVKDGLSERGGYPVEQKLMKQWSLRITAYADRLLQGLDSIDWPDAVKEMQRNWIGKSEGCSLRFDELTVFTTRPDTIFGVSFLVLAPEHELVDSLCTDEYRDAVNEYKTYASKKSERDRMSDVKTISGQFTGAYAKHPFTAEELPIWIADYVLANYGTGAVMAVPAHDSRDYAFAKHFNLPIIPVIEGSDISEQAFDAKEGIMCNSDFLNGLEVKAAIAKAIDKIEERNLGTRKVNFRLRDAIFGRQRYWGEPIPVYYKNDIPYLMEEKDLPLTLPTVDKFLPTESGEPPLARASNWKYQDAYEYELTTMPGWAGSSWYYLRYMDAKNAEAFVSPAAMQYWGQVDLYIGGAEHATGHLLYARFWNKFLKDKGLVAHEEPFKKLINQGMIQGRSNFVYRLIGDYRLLDNSVTQMELPQIFISANLVGQLNNVEFKNRLKDGISIGLSDLFHEKSKFLSFAHTSQVNKLHVDVNIVKNDVLDLFNFSRSRLVKNLIFILDDESIAVSTDGNYMQSGTAGRYLCDAEVEKMSKSKYNVVNPDDIIECYGADTLRMYEMFLGPLEQSKPWNTNGIEGVFKFLRKFWKLMHNEQFEFNVSDEAPKPAELKALHKIIKKVEEDVERFSFNTSVSSFMICVNELSDLKCNKRAILKELCVVLAPYAPHITEECWKLLGGTGSVHNAVYPTYDEQYLTEANFAYPVSFNGKTRLNIEMPVEISEEDAKAIVLANADVQKQLEGKSLKKFIFVKGRIVNLVV